MKKFALIGAAGFIAHRHIEAIYNTKNTLVVALDKSDTVGVLDSYFPDADFFTEFERFDRYFEKIKRKGHTIDYVSICSPNYLHDAHARFALRHGAHAICEKPLVLSPWNVDALAQIEKETHQRIYPILQLRLHPSIVALRKEILSEPASIIHDISLDYVTPRGHWYYVSWKGDEDKSGGIVTNIGIHFFDMLIWIFGQVKKVEVTSYTPSFVSGYLEMTRARVRWKLSIDRAHLPPKVLKAGKRIYRSLVMDGKEIEFSDGFTSLHTESYEAILNGKGFTIEDARAAINLTYQIRNTKEKTHPHS